MSAVIEIEYVLILKIAFTVALLLFSLTLADAEFELVIVPAEAGVIVQCENS
ncbi:MAG: hypothetical protein BWY67_01045 [Bacteroidetes bacterium ADurb.Bin397]|nr:MAG: hypothetical protein BWY67_01045 [Bacteroidetes bacterium ADurb.Bin397]